MPGIVYLDIEPFTIIDHKTPMNWSCRKVTLCLYWRNAMMVGLLVHHSVRAISARSPAITLNVFEVDGYYDADDDDD